MKEYLMSPEFAVFARFMIMLGVLISTVLLADISGSLRNRRK